MPLGIGFSHRVQPLILDARDVYRPVFYGDLMDNAEGGGEVRLDNWTAI